MMRTKLKNLRQAKGYSPQDMAHLMNRSQSAYSRIESGESPLYEDELFELCGILECRPEHLMENSAICQTENNYACATYIQRVSDEQRLLKQNHAFFGKNVATE